MDEPPPGEGSNANNAGGPVATDPGLDGQHGKDSPSVNEGDAPNDSERGDTGDNLESDAHRLGVTVDLPLEGDDGIEFE